MPIDIGFALIQVASNYTQLLHPRGVVVMWLEHL